MKVNLQSVQRPKNPITKYDFIDNTREEPVTVTVYLFDRLDQLEMHRSYEVAQAYIKKYITGEPEEGKPAAPFMAPPQTGINNSYLSESLFNTVCQITALQPIVLINPVRDAEGTGIPTVDGSKNVDRYTPDDFIWMTKLYPEAYRQIQEVALLRLRSNKEASVIDDLTDSENPTQEADLPPSDLPKERTVFLQNSSIVPTPIN